MRFFREIAKHFGIGLVTILPFALVIWVLVTIFRLVDGMFGPWVNNIFGVEVPGVGFVLVLIGTTLVGALTKVYISHEFLQLMDALFRRIPFVKSLYTAFTELVQSLLGGKRRGFRRAVLVEWPDDRAKVVGLVTNEEIPSSMDPTGTLVAVYLPNTFQFAGITVLVDASRITPCDLSVEEAFKFSLSGGLTNVHTDRPVRKQRIARAREMPAAEDDDRYDLDAEPATERENKPTRMPGNPPAGSSEADMKSSSG
ncbi:DUF502 domain-containing protein [Alicyclobacillus sp. ALC3]|uniref:DUF502 domain-containing protein n=1 Tax=Alicyclobacillus sp. ALC3 TaxID=2796143 RepID=UPI0023795884|nr:DUF502 domain-containing protein [Alicyclobacillus sp. ALC3]WDL96879.1 DUF502 domain-containing protein [Alicyclobacillus sp. ALC3]